MSNEMSSLNEHSTGRKQWGCSKMTVGTTSYDWTITNFSLRPEDIHQKIVSPVFYSDANQLDHWRLELYPKGDDQTNKDHLSLFLRLIESNKREIFIQCKLAILNPSDNTKLCVKKFSRKYMCGTTLGYPNFISRNNLMHPANNLMKDDSLTISCEIDIPLNTVQTSFEDDLRLQAGTSRKRRLADDLEVVLLQKKWSDVHVIVGDKKYFAHRLMLSARSPVFASMFDDRWKQQAIHVLEIKDIHQEVVKGCLQFIYTDEVSGLQDRVIDYLSAAEKYQLAGLKVKCEEIITGMVNEQTAADFLVVAERFNAVDLKKQLIQYIVKHLSGVIDSKGYKELEKNNPILLGQIIRAQVGQYEKKTGQEKKTSQEKTIS